MYFMFINQKIIKVFNKIKKILYTYLFNDDSCLLNFKNQNILFIFINFFFFFFIVSIINGIYIYVFFDILLIR